MRLRNSYQELKSEVDNKILEITKSHNKLINESITDLVNSGGKRLRPLLLIFSSHFGKFEKDKVMELAAGVEILHMASLIHDDIIDEAKLRRGVTTAQEKFDKKTAVFIGDYLLARAYNNFEEILSPVSRKRLNKVVRLICEGEIKQYQNRFNYDLSLIQYLKRIRRKTALLFGLSTYIGAYESGVRGKVLYNLYNIGLEMGMTFQIQDDILDFTGKKEIMGKGFNQDLESGIYTLPLILLLKRNKFRDDLIKLLQNVNLNENEFNQIQELVQASGVVKESKELGKRFIEKARFHINNLPQIRASKELQKIMDRQLKRRY